MDKTINWLAAKSGYDPKVVYAWNEGRNLPCVYAAIDVAQALGLSVKDLWKPTKEVK